MRSSISCSKEQRELFNEIKREFAIASGKKIFEVTDREIFQILLDNYMSYKNQCILSLIKELTNQLEGIASLLNIAEDYEKLKQENEELRKQIEELKSRQTETKLPEDPKEAYNLFVKVILDKIPASKREDVERSLRLFQLAVFSDGINIEILKRLGEWAEETVYLIKFGKENKEDYETEMRGGVTLW